jgi:DNA-directed RNA polymerase specialized sigma54-like protein
MNSEENVQAEHSDSSHLPTQVPSHEPLAAEQHVIVSLAHELSAGGYLTAATTTAQRRRPHLHGRTGILDVD